MNVVYLANYSMITLYISCTKLMIAYNMEYGNGMLLHFVIWVANFRYFAQGVGSLRKCGLFGQI